MTDLIVPPQLCDCCQHTEHTTDKNGEPWIQPRQTTAASLALKSCRRCDRACSNERCDQLPANPDGRGYGPLPPWAVKS